MNTQWVVFWLILQIRLSGAFVSNRHFWYSDIEKKWLQLVATNDELSIVFHKFESRKIVTFVVEFPIKPSYKSSMTVEVKLEKLPVRRNPNLSTGTK